jgi:hypothetical protein
VHRIKLHHGYCKPSVGLNVGATASKEKPRPVIHILLGDVLLGVLHRESTCFVMFGVWTAVITRKTDKNAAYFRVLGMVEGPLLWCLMSVLAC